MKKVIRVACVFVFLLNFIRIGFSQIQPPPYNPKLNVITTPSDIINTGFVEYTTTNIDQGDLRFTLFGDGYFSNLNDFSHQYTPNNGNYVTTTHFSKKYKVSIPTVRTKTIVDPGSGNSGNSLVSMPTSTGSRIATSWQPSIGFENYYMLIFENTSLPTATGCIEFYYNDADLTLNTSGILEYGWVKNRVITNITGPGLYNKKIKWNFDDLAYGEQRIVYIPMVTTATTGSLINVGSKYNVGCSGSGVMNNSRFVSNGSPHDPNSKTANKDCVSANIGDRQSIIYTVKFQNEGDGPAKDVVLVDILDESKFDLGSLVFLDSEYNYSYNLSGNELSITFKNIYLPGLKQKGKYIYTYEETESFVQFKICTKPNLSYGVIENVVQIYFDDQPPIETNVSKVVINDDCGIDSCDSGDEDDENEEEAESEEGRITSTETLVGFDINISPNPIENYLYINGLKGQKVATYIYNNRGELIQVNNGINENNNQLNLETLSSGLYFIQVKNEMINFTKKILKL